MTKQTELFLQQTDLERTILIGYYGGGNYGDELLLEVLANHFVDKNIKDLTITYQTPDSYHKFHHNFGYKLIPMGSKVQLIQAIVHNKRIVVGGGGLWGLDVNLNIFLLSFLLWIAQFVLRKKIYLLAVGYYSSTTKLGRLSAWLAGKSATHIVARDKETFENFGAISKRVTLGSDLAWLIPKLDLAPYQADLNKLEKQLSAKSKTLFITLRRFKPNQKNHFTELVEQCIADNPDKKIIVSLLEPNDVDPTGYTLLKLWQKKYQNIQIADFSYNPLALYLFFEKHHKNLALIGPQFHIIITAQLCKVPYLPIVYDNKVAALLTQVGKSRQLPIKELEQSQLQQFVDTAFKGEEQTA
jgi:polysaccharide pyruvyl transferase WcaK-like protein